MRKTNKALAKRVVATAVVCSMALAISPVITAQGAAKQPTLSKTKLTIAENVVKKLKVKKNGFTIKSTKWSSSKKKVASVTQKGVVTGESEGKANIIAKVKAVAKGKKKAKTYTLKCKVTVTAEPEDFIEGGWETAEDPTITEELREMFNKALEGLDGASYEPVALLSTQVVAGMNYRFLARQTLVTAEPKTTYAVVEIYKDLSGAVDISKANGDGIYPTSVEAAPKDPGESGWKQAVKADLGTHKYALMEGILKDPITYDGVTGVYKPVAAVEQKDLTESTFDLMLICEAGFIGSDSGDVQPYSFIVIHVDHVAKTAEFVSATYFSEVTVG